VDAYSCGQHQYSKYDLVIYGIPVDDTGRQESVRGGIHIVGIYLLAPYEKYVEADESSDMGNTVTRLQTKARFCVEQYKASVACNQDHRYLVSQLGLVKHSCMKCKAPNTDKGEPLNRGSGMGNSYRGMQTHHISNCVSHWKGLAPSS